MTTRVELVVQADPMLKNELLDGAKGAFYSKANPLQAARAFLRRLTGEADQWKTLGRITAERAIASGMVEAIQTPCTVTWTHLRTHAGTIDTAAIAMPTWSLLDGLVKGGLLAGDDYKRVVEQRYRVELGSQYEGIRVVMETVPGAPIQGVITGVDGVESPMFPIR